MKKNYLWIQIIAVIIIQALFLTQVDFSLAASYHCKETYQEAALKFQNIADKKISLIVGAACVQSTLSSLYLPKLTLSRIFSLLGAGGKSFVEFISNQQVCPISKNIYKDFNICAENFTVLKISGIKKRLALNIRGNIKIKTSKKSNAPPVLAKNIFDDFTMPNC